MRLPKDFTTRGFIHTAAFDADITVLHHVHTADGIVVTELVQIKNHLQGVGDDRFVLLIGNRNRKAVLEFEGQKSLLVYSLLRTQCQAEHIFFAPLGGVFQDARLVADVDKILILAVRFLGGCLDGNAVLLGIRNHIASSFELRQPLGVLPWADDFHLWHVHVITEFKADLVVSLSRCTVGNIDSSFLAGDFNLAFGDDGPGQ